MAKHGLNIANMSLSRNSVGGVALNICSLDSEPSEEARKDLFQNKDIKAVHLVDLKK
jgi:D-3-phosphoglycerate dehydrogenase / 2-oxoglutarate reductase